MLMEMAFTLANQIKRQKYLNKFSNAHTHTHLMHAPTHPQLDSIVSSATRIYKNAKETMTGRHFFTIMRKEIRISSFSTAPLPCQLFACKLEQMLSDKDCFGFYNPHNMD
jgi:hypothetical protein